MSCVASGGVFLACLSLLVVVVIFMEPFSRRRSRRHRKVLAETLREFTSYSKDLILIIEDLICIEPEREEALSIARLELIAKTKACNEITDRMERKRWWS